MNRSLNEKLTLEEAGLITKFKTVYDPVVFIIGPYMGDSKGDYVAIEDNIRRAELAAIELANHGIAFVCPHTHTAMFHVKAKASEEFYRRMYLRMLVEVADFVLLLPGYASSEGSKIELQKAQELHLPVFSSIISIANYIRTTREQEETNQS